ncbi:MAG: ribosome biogenesis GTP-binding protein YihA/YsxC [Caulobacterales bacterium]
MFRQPVEFTRGVVNLDGLPPDDRPEVAFAGRSNVGKSSLLNALVQRRSLARASGDPGRTRELNFFALGVAPAPHLYLVDLPGYGYAKVSASAVKQWTKLTQDYLRGRTSLKRVLLLVDSRHGLKPADVEIMDVLDVSAVVYMIVLTKTDKLKSPEIEAVQSATAKAISRRPGAFPRLCAVSSKSGAGMENLRAEIAALAR